MQFHIVNPPCEKHCPTFTKISLLSSHQCHGNPAKDVPSICSYLHHLYLDNTASQLALQRKHSSNKTLLTGHKAVMWLVYKGTVAGDAY